MQKMSACETIRPSERKKLSFSARSALLWMSPQRSAFGVKAGRHDKSRAGQKQLSPNHMAAASTSALHGCDKTPRTSLVKPDRP
ncbi:unnamed protein product [Boreogadus saida]